MKLLAIELSTGAGSIALFEDGIVANSWTWTEERRQSRMLFDHLAKVPALDAIDVFSVGIGPGNYSGLRAALTATQALALPGEREVYCVSSGDALVADVAPRGASVVIGDARRSVLWAGWFVDGQREGEWALCSWDDIAARVTVETHILSPDAERITEQYPVSDLAAHWPKLNAQPSAVAVARLAASRIAAGVPSELATPLYLQPAV